MPPDDLQRRLAEQRAIVRRQQELIEAIAELADAIRDLPDGRKTKARRALETLLHRLGQLPSGAQYATIARMSATADTADAAPAADDRPKKLRRGPALRSHGPIALAATNAGKSVFELARDLGENYDTVRSWDRRKNPPAYLRKKLAAPPYNIPSDAWK